MAKRFTDTEKWKKEWFQGLTVLEKLLWVYICDNCDQSGVFEMNLRMISFLLGLDIKLSDFDKLMHQIEKLESGKYWIRDFISFQNGTLSKASPAHKPIFDLINRHSLSSRLFNTLSNNPMVIVKEKVMVKGIVKGGVGEKVEPIEQNDKPISDELNTEWEKWKKYSNEHGKKYMGVMAEEAALMGLLDLVGRDEVRAIATIKYTMKNNWKNFIIPETKVNGSETHLIVKRGQKASD